jgi:saccharopine dehydrogenase-like NADP-dependent oxidoreductase
MTKKKQKVAIVGGGRIGKTIAKMLAPHYSVIVLDSCPVDFVAGTGSRIVNAGDAQELQAALAGRFAVINAAPHQLNEAIAAAAAECGISYLDLSEDVHSAYRVSNMAPDGCSFIPQCGLAPGFVSILAADMASRFEVVDSIKMRVGALPQNPSNALGYNLTWSTAGLINEYCEPCLTIVNGNWVSVPALAQREEFWLDGERYEAFNTSGGVGSLCERFAGKVRELNYRTIRYPGHVRMMDMMLNDLRLRDRRGLLIDILEYAVPQTDKDVVIIYVSVTGTRQGRFYEDTYATRIYPHDGMTAIQRTTASSACAVFDLLATGKLPQRSVIRQEDIPLSLFLENRFGSVFRC